MPTPFHRQTPAQLDHSSLGRVVYGTGHALVRNQSAHTRHKQDRSTTTTTTTATDTSTATSFVPKHLFCCGRRAVEDPVIVDLHDLVERLLRMSDGAVNVVDARGADYAIEPLSFAGYLGHECVDVRFIAHVDLSVVDAAAIRTLGAVFGGFEFVVGGLKTVKTPYC